MGICLNNDGVFFREILLELPQPHEGLGLSDLERVVLFEQKFFVLDLSSEVLGDAKGRLLLSLNFYRDSFVLK